VSWGALAATALRGLANYVGAAAPATPASASPVKDVSTGIGAAIAVLDEVKARNLTLSDAEAFANAVQQILVDLGVEPGIVLEASKLLEAVAPVFVSAWTSGLITGGDPAFPPGGGPDHYPR
jgi:bifunctional ADP-heptose synthase (sugar kinase/adenylyltransferase)